MKNQINIKKKITSNWFKFLQYKIIEEFKKIENNSSKKKINFVKKVWKKNGSNEGGGTSFVLSNGKVFEKVGVNHSIVSGKFSKNFRKNILGAEKNGNYWASGISVVAHMKNPKIPAFHFNTRYIVTEKDWFGGGMDVTPSHEDKKEKNFLQKELKKLCLSNNKNYSKYKKYCDKYFYLRHRNEPRGIGGIFFDYETKNWEKNFKFVRDLGVCFIVITKSIINKKMIKNWNNKDKEKQLLKRGRYVEFNLLYDRGTKFGLNSGGNIDSILMSLPPSAKWK